MIGSKARPKTRQGMMLNRILQTLTPRRTNLLIGAVALVWLLALTFVRGLWTDVTAAWVQAIGSVVAIAASTAVATRLARGERAQALADARQFALAAAFDVVKFFALLVATLEEPRAATPPNLAMAWDRIEFAEGLLAQACTPQLGSSRAIGALYALRHHAHVALTQGRGGDSQAPRLGPGEIVRLAANVAASYDAAAQAVGEGPCNFARLVEINRRSVRKRMPAMETVAAE